MTPAAVIEGDKMAIRYTCNGKAIGQTMFDYTPEAYLDWFRSMIGEMNPATEAGTKKNKQPRGKRIPAGASRSRRRHSLKRGSGHRVSG